MYLGNIEVFLIQVLLIEKLETNRTMKNKAGLDTTDPHLSARWGEPIAKLTAKARTRPFDEIL